MTKTFVIPTNPTDLKKLKSAIQEGSNCLLRIDAEKEALKDIVEAAKEEFELPKNVISQLIRATHKADFDKKATEFSDFEDIYTVLQNA